MFAYGNFTFGWRLLLVLLCVAFGTQALWATTDLELDNELLLELRLDGDTLGLDVLGYQRGQDFLLSLDEITNGLGFPITVDGDQGSASGWYISEDRGFSLDLERGEVISNGQQWQLVDGEAVLFQGGLYVATEALQRWFPLQLSAVVRELYLDVEPTETLPIQERLNRRNRVITGTTGYQEPQYPLQETPYRFIGPHSTKLRLGFSTLRRAPTAGAEFGSNYALLSRGDLGWMTSTIALAGQSESSITGALLKLERTSFDGPLGLNHIEIGDVDAGGFRGVLVRGNSSLSKSIDSRFENDSVTLEGNQLPDWDVELYRNNQLILRQTTGQDGRYVFEDVPLQFGENRFELKFFGPFGEVESREEFHYLGDNLLEPGRISYEFSAVQDGRTVFGVNDIKTDSDRHSGTYAADFNLGVTRNLSVQAGVESRETNGVRLEASNIGFALGTSRYFTSMNYVDTPDAQNSLNTSFRTRLSDTSLSLSYTQFFDEPSLGSSTQKWQTALDISSSVFDRPVKLEINNIETENNSDFNALVGTTLPLSGAGSISSSLWYSSYDELTDENTLTLSRSGGQTSFYTAIDPWSFRLSSSYTLDPDIELLDLTADSSLRIDRGLSLDLGIQRRQTTETTFYTSGINWQLEKFSINARLSYDSNERWAGLISFSTTLLPQRGTLLPRFEANASINAGIVETRVFDDTNGANEQGYALVNVEAGQTWQRATTNQNGVAYLSLAQPYRQVDIEVNEGTLPEYEMKSKIAGVSVIPRPGSYVLVDFPIVKTAELEGHVFVGEGENRQPVSRALVILKSSNGDVIAQRRTAFDGFYLFDGIQPNDYVMTLEERFAGRLLNGPAEISVLTDSALIRDLDFKLSKVKAQAITLAGSTREELSQPTTQELSQKLPEDPLIAAANSLPTSSIQTSTLPMLETEATPQADQGKWFVQIGAFGSQAIAQASWERLSQNMQELKGKTPQFSAYKTMTRLLVGPGQSKDAASQLCQQLKADQLDCMIRKVD